MQWSSQPLNQIENYYFDYELFKTDNNQGIDTAQMKWYSDLLREYNEQSFYYDSSHVNAFRFFVGRIFQKPYLLRVEKQDNQVYLFHQEIIKGSTGELDLLAPEGKTELSIDCWDNLVGIISKINFWENDKANPAHRYRCNPGQTIIEGWLDGKHQVLLDNYLNVKSVLKIKKVTDDLTDETPLLKPVQVLPRKTYERD